MTAHPCVVHPGRTHPDGPCTCFRGHKTAEFAQRCPQPGCGREWVVDSIRQQCEDEGHVGGVGA